MYLLTGKSRGAKLNAAAYPQMKAATVRPLGPVVRESGSKGRDTHKYRSTEMQAMVPMAAVPDRPPTAP